MKASQIAEIKAGDPYQAELNRLIKARFPAMTHLPVVTLPQKEFKGIACVSMETRIDDDAPGWSEAALDRNVKQLVILNRDTIDREGIEIMDALLQHEYFHADLMPVTPRGGLIECALIRGVVREAPHPEWFKDMDWHDFDNILEDMFADWNGRRGNAAWAKLLESMVAEATTGWGGGKRSIDYPMDLLYFVRCHRSVGPEAPVTRELKAACLKRLGSPEALEELTRILEESSVRRSNTSYLRALVRLTRFVVAHWPEPKPQNQDQSQGQGAGGQGPPSLEDPMGGLSGLGMGATEEDIGQAIDDLMDGPAGEIARDEGVTPDLGALKDPIEGMIKNGGGAGKQAGSNRGLAVETYLEVLKDPELRGILFPPTTGESEGEGLGLPLRLPSRDGFSFGRDRIRDLDIKASVKRFGGKGAIGKTHLLRRRELTLDVPALMARTNTPSVFMAVDTSGSVNVKDIVQGIAVVKKTADELNAGFGIVLFHSTPYYQRYWPNARDVSVLSMIERVETGGTELGRALYAVLGQVADHLRSEQGSGCEGSWLVIQSDFDLSAGDKAIYRNLCLHHPTFAAMRQVHLSIKNRPLELGHPHASVVAQSYKAGAVEVRKMLQASRFEPSFGLSSCY